MEMSIIMVEIDISLEIDHMNWSVADAKQQLSEVLRRAATRPQTITKRARDIAVVIDVQEFREFQQWKSAGRKKTVAEAFEDLRLLSGTRGPALKAPARRDRRRAFFPPAK
ncbi:MAG TPA: type II toxin-antitoxin system prevent-host-death family antitoxin [Vicinamibacteria bacterium]|nr:type II toxin-antitoxin system prevent-host-death family antitoxin [Vicinamibacteria bacterium]